MVLFSLEKTGVTWFKGTVSQDFLLLVFFMDQFPPGPKYSIKTPFWIFSNIRADIRKSRCTTAFNETGGKFATGVNDTGSKIAAGFNDTGGNLPPVSTTLVANFLTGVVDGVNAGSKQWEKLSNCWQLKMNLKNVFYLYANSTTQRCPKK